MVEEISSFSADVEEWLEGAPRGLAGAHPDLQTVEKGLEQTGHTPKEQKSHNKSQHKVSI